jgi:hypothetical protein
MAVPRHPCLHGISASMHVDGEKDNIEHIGDVLPFFFIKLRQIVQRFFYFLITKTPLFYRFSHE